MLKVEPTGSAEGSHAGMSDRGPQCFTLSKLPSPEIGKIAEGIGFVEKFRCLIFILLVLRSLAGIQVEISSKHPYIEAEAREKCRLHQL